jgi:hypothetical protein
LQERCRQLRERVEAEAPKGWLASSPAALAGTVVSRGRAGRGKVWRHHEAPPVRILYEMVAAEDIHDYLNEAMSRAGTSGDPLPELSALARDTALLAALRPDESGWQHERVLMFVGELQSAPVQKWTLVRSFLDSFQFRFTDESDGGLSTGLEVSAGRVREAAELFAALELLPETRQQIAEARCDVLLFEGLRAGRLLAGEEGTHLFVLRSGQLVPFQAALRPLADGQTPDEAIQAALTAHRHWLADRRSGRMDLPAPLFPIRPVVRIYDQRGKIIDLATGGTIEHTDERIPISLDEFIKARLPAPS